METKDLSAKLDRIVDDLTEIKITSAKQEVNLAEHMRRTELAETNLDQIRQDLKPVQKHVTMVHGVLKFLGVVSMVLGIVYTTYQLTK